MDLKTACERSGGFMCNGACILGANKITEIEPGRYLIDSPHGTFKVRSSTVRLSAHGMLFPFSNCALEVTREKIIIECYVPVKDEKGNVHFEEEFSAVIY